MHVDSIARTRAPLSSKLCLNNASTWSWRSSLRPINRIGYCAPPEISSCEPDCDARSYTIFPRTTFCSEMARSMAASRRSSSARRSATSRSKASRRWRISPRPMGTLCLPTTVHPLSRGHQYNIATAATAPPGDRPQRLRGRSSATTTRPLRFNSARAYGARHGRRRPSRRQTCSLVDKLF